MTKTSKRDGMPLLRRSGSIPRNSLSACLVLFLGAFGCSGSGGSPAVGDNMDGKLVDGLRVITFDAEASGQRIRIYRGDYVRPELSTGNAFTLEIPDLKVDTSFPVAEGERPYFKVPDAGEFAFRIGSASGVIEALEYTAANYSEVSPSDARAMIENVHPLLLDVRTEREFSGGHIEGAKLIPVQQFHERISELEQYKREPILVYCATGNRSTVASKLLIDAGFERVVNLRTGVRGWQGAGLPLVR